MPLSSYLLSFFVRGESQRRLLSHALSAKLTSYRTVHILDQVCTLLTMSVQTPHVLC